MNRLAETFLVSLKLGLGSFGGPLAHLGFFHDEYVTRRKWLDDAEYADLVALCQFLPGPASSQLGMAIGAKRAGVPGSLAAWLGFTLPSAAVMTALALLAGMLDPAAMGGSAMAWLHGFRIAALALVFQAVLSMWRKLASTRVAATIALAVAAVTLVWRSAAGQVLVILAAGCVGLLFRPAPAADAAAEPHEAAGPSAPGLRAGLAFLAVFLILLAGLPVLGAIVPGALASITDGFYRAGSLVFGGGHVVLPLLQEEAVAAGLATEDLFLAGYGAVQAMPGPMFSFGAYLGALGGGLAGAVVGLVSIFLPAWLLIMGALPFWQRLRRDRRLRGAMDGMGAAVVGLLLAALYHPLWTGAIRGPADLVIAMVLAGFLMVWKLPPPAVVALGSVGAALAGIVTG